MIYHLARDDNSRVLGGSSVQVALPKDYARRLWRAVIEFELLAEGDRVLVGFSGGKDSSFLLYALRALQEQAPFGFELGAVHVELGFREPSDVPQLERYCQQLEIPFYLEKTQIAQVAFKQRQENPCSSCAYFRRAVVNETAVVHGYNKVALAHHHDDAVETFLMSQLYSGKLQTFLPKSHLEKTGLDVIRPLVYLREEKIKAFMATLAFRPMPSRCPLQGKTHRWKVKELIHTLTQENPFVYANLAAAMRGDGLAELWPPVPSKKTMREKHLRVMRPASEEHGSRRTSNAPKGVVFDFHSQ